MADVREIAGYADPISLQALASGDVAVVSVAKDPDEIHTVPLARVGPPREPKVVSGQIEALRTVARIVQRIPPDVWDEAAHSVALGYATPTYTSEELVSIADDMEQDIPGSAREDAGPGEDVLSINALKVGAYRALVALRLEVPQEIADDIWKRVWTLVSRLEDENDRLSQAARPVPLPEGEERIERVARYLYTHRWAPGDGLPRVWDLVGPEDRVAYRQWATDLIQRTALTRPVPLPEEEKHELKEALGDLVVGVLRWGREEDGIPEWVWPHYVTACALLGWAVDGTDAHPHARPVPLPEGEERFEGCDICGGRMVWIRGEYPGADDRPVCPTCAAERLERIREIVTLRRPEEGEDDG